MTLIRRCVCASLLDCAAVSVPCGAAPWTDAA